MVALADLQEAKILKTKSPETLRVVELVKQIFPGARVVK
jgi:hypothetical protein